MKEVHQRIITAAIIISAVLISLFWLPEGVFNLILTASLIMVGWEYQKLVMPGLIYPATLNLMVMLLAGFGVAGFINMKWLWWLASCWWVLVVPVLLLEFSRGKRLEWLNYPAANNIVALLMLVGCYSAIIDLRSYLGNFGVLYLLMISSISDTAAYFLGKRFGKHQFAEHISPAKTIEGVLGSVVCVVLLSLALKPLLIQKLEMGLMKPSNISTGYLLFITVWSVVASVLGDLWESVLKRRAGVKDSGNILPGHGGMFDRLDSLIAVAPILALGLLL